MPAATRSSSACCFRRVATGWTAPRAAEALRSNLAALKDIADDAERRLFAALRFAEDEIAEELRPLLVPLALHERFVQTDLVAIMAEQSGSGLTPTLVDRLVATLAAAGLLRQAFGYVFELHPALTSFLRSSVLECTDPETRDRWTAAFVEGMAASANAATPLPFHEQQPFFRVYGENFRSALDAAERLAIVPAFPALLLSIASYAQNTRDLATAERLYGRRSSFFASRGESVFEANAYHQLGLVAQERRDLDAAERWYLKSLAIKQKQGDEHGAATTCHQLGMIAQGRRDFDAAERWCLKSLAITEKQGNQHDAAATYHQLGMITQERRDLDAAERWYLKSLAIKENQGDEHEAASTYAHLGVLAALRARYVDAGRWMIRSTRSFLATNDRHQADRSTANFRLLLRRAMPADQAALRALWREAGLPEIPLDGTLP